MSTKITLAALAALLAAMAMQAPAVAHDLQSGPSATRLKGAAPADAYASSYDRPATSLGHTATDVVFGGKIIGRDPDQNVRLELLRDRDLGQN